MTTEFRLEGPDCGSPGLFFFTPQLIKEVLIGDLPWELLSPQDFQLSDETRNTECLQTKAVETFRDHVAKYKRLLYHKLEQVTYPLIVMRDGPYVWTSVSLALRKALVH